MIKLSLLLEKDIISILAKEINKYNKTITFFGQDEQEKAEKDSIISELVKSMSLVNWHWFNSLSSELVSLVNFSHSPLSPTIKLFDYLWNKNIIETTNDNNNNNNNNNSDNNNKFKLIKNENIKYIRLNISEISLTEIDQDKMNQFIDFINKKVNEFKNLKKLVISNGMENDDIIFTNKLDFHYIRLGFLYLGIKLDDEEQEEGRVNQLITKSPLSPNIKEVIDSEGFNMPPSRLVSILKPLKKIENLIIDRADINLYIELYKQLIGADDDENTSCLTFAKSLTIDNYQVHTVESLYYVLKLVPNIHELSFQICFDNLVLQIDGTTKGCMCSELDECNKNFMHYWKFITECIENHKTLKLLSIGQHCTFPIAYATQFKLPIKFIESFGSAIANNKSIKIFKTSKLPPNCSDFFEFIFKNNQTITRHSHYFLNMTIDSLPTYVDDFKNLIDQYKHIEVFFISDSTFGDVFTHNSLKSKKE
ncbi:hypothetical protein DDB_G0285397 [Dictyostelium discoideum AX4]|uniref:Uncharacterized protein n=1 Tax=Dictyostelium discoideum TaxID=44689 RepID=Q54NC2_DICDI|nr:hypothetical protein DDB_G0285397 [Dictyostelium discoideum AX4]EAL64773.1 hypothetical protein DDB_G0285397 [Dictyostelium discoideum AX4]|eukprot:XP_638258.1 hypothetical protein DDB_G0285397 [Dictyostelium discoideum AX4]